MTTPGHIAPTCPYTHNWMGAPGAWLSDILLFVFGLSAWWLPLYAALMVWFGQRDDERFSPELLQLGGSGGYGGFTVLLLSARRLRPFVL